MPKVTIIDDSQATIDMLSNILQANDYNVTSHQSPHNVEEKIADEQPDIILLDIVMPDRNGYEVLRGLKRHQATKHIPVVLVSSKNEETDIRWGIRQGAVKYITKPFTAEAIISTVQDNI